MLYGFSWFRVCLRTHNRVRLFLENALPKFWKNCGLQSYKLLYRCQQMQIITSIFQPISVLADFPTLGASSTDRTVLKALRINVASPLLAFQLRLISHVQWLCAKSSAVTIIHSVFSLDICLYFLIIIEVILHL